MDEEEKRGEEEESKQSQTLAIKCATTATMDLEE
jgi:hypothetical protein